MRYMRTSEKFFTFWWKASTNKEKGPLCYIGYPFTITPPPCFECWFVSLGLQQPFCDHEATEVGETNAGEEGWKKPDNHGLFLGFYLSNGKIFVCLFKLLLIRFSITPSYINPNGYICFLYYILFQLLPEAATLDFTPQGYPLYAQSPFHMAEF